MSLGATPLYVASARGHTVIVRALLEADADHAVRVERTSPLYLAAQDGHTGVVDALVAAKADVNAVPALRGRGQGGRSGILPAETIPKKGSSPS